MNEFENLENRLRSRVPRPPSHALRERLFAGAAAGEAPGVTSPAGVARWLSPATAAVFISLVICGPPNSRMLQTARSTGGAFAAAALSNQFYAAYLDPSLHTLQNAASSRIELANLGHAQPSAATVLGMRTNNLPW